LTTAKAKIANAAGIHVRPSGLIFAEIQDSEAEITLSCNGRSAKINSVMSLIALGMAAGDEVEVSVTGPEEEQICRRLVESLERRYDFPQK